MSRTGWWLVAATRPDVPPDYREGLLAAIEERRRDPRLQELLAGWRAHREEVADELSWLGHLDEQWLVGLSRDTLGHEDSTLLRMVGTRKLSPFSALLHGVGPQRVEALPGLLGNLLLTPDELVAALPVIRSALRFDDPEREQALRRMRDWIARVGDDPETDPAEILDVLPEVAAAAVARGMGLLAVTSDL